MFKFTNKEGALEDSGPPPLTPVKAEPQALLLCLFSIPLLTTAPPTSGLVSNKPLFN